MGGDLHDLELMIRGAAIGGFLGLALCLVRVEAPRLRVSGLLFCLSTAAHIVTQTTPSRMAFDFAFPPIWTLSVMGTGFFWTFATDLFSDAARPLWRRYWPAAMLMVMGLATLIAPSDMQQAPWFVHSVAGLVVMAHAGLVIALGWRDDLVESRRQLRAPVLIAGSAYGVINGAVQAVEITWRPVPALSPVAAVTLLALALCGIAVFLKADAALFAGRARDGAPPDASPVDRAALARLKQAMDQEEAWRREALSMFELAKIVGAPEHRLRRLINDGLGYRNFTAFLNERRIAAAKSALEGRPETPVSSIAYEVGFASLGPFNRAFKAETGMTPTRWRESALA